MLSVLDNVVCRSVESVIIEIEVHLADESGWRLAWNRSRRGGAFILNQKDGCTRQPSSSSNHHRKTDALARQFLRLPDQVDPLQTDLGTNWTEKFNALRQSQLIWSPATQFIRYIWDLPLELEETREIFSQEWPKLNQTDVWLLFIGSEPQHFLQSPLAIFPAKVLLWIAKHWSAFLHNET